MHSKSSAWCWPLSFPLLTPEPLLLLIATPTASHLSLQEGPVATGKSIYKPIALSYPPLPWDVWGGSDMFLACYPLLCVQDMAQGAQANEGTLSWDIIHLEGLHRSPALT